MFDAAWAFALSRPRVTLTRTVMDFAHAYNHLGLDQESRRVAVIALASPSGQIVVAYWGAQAFGPRRAPANWDRVTQFAAFDLKKVFRAWVGICFGDLFAPNPEKRPSHPERL